MKDTRKRTGSELIVYEGLFTRISMSTIHRYKYLVCRGVLIKYEHLMKTRHLEQMLSPCSAPLTASLTRTINVSVTCSSLVDITGVKMECISFCVFQLNGYSRESR